MIILLGVSSSRRHFGRCPADGATPGRLAGELCWTVRGLGEWSYVDVLKTEPGLLFLLFCALVAAAAYVGRYGIVAWQAFKARPPRMRRFYEGGFQATMTRREAALILGVR
ncbi:hypothetical protein V8G54_035802 [Vigna mungo]|uniref:Uncharacterized protein n=1 Tax=Vigna mungo TaxID=3915 RepID=A0AAQ3RBM4_VIGMU